MSKTQTYMEGKAYLLLQLWDEMQRLQSDPRGVLTLLRPFVQEKLEFEIISIITNTNSSKEFFRVFSL